MPRDLHLVVFNSQLFPTHWSIWVLSNCLNHGGFPVGKLIHVVGDVAHGFDHKFKRNYVLGETTRQYQTFFLTSVLDEFIVDVVGDRSYGTDKITADSIERCALSIPAPEKSLKSADS